MVLSRKIALISTGGGARLRRALRRIGALIASICPRQSDMHMLMSNHLLFNSMLLYGMESRKWTMTRR